ncbi:MAG: heme A synthase [Aquabacterium sp.]|nr:MAG: heme A synthase [Aquabacterium sp.]
MSEATLWTLKPLVQLALVGALISAVLLLSLVRKGVRPGETLADARVRRLAALTLFFTFDLIVFGSFTRLTDSGLGCPDWPGCYGSASPIGAHAHISQAQAAMPTGPVTHGKAWIEMIHRYLGSAVGMLILALIAATWVAARRNPRLRRQLPWAIASLWVIPQGLFGMWTVTLKLYPAIVTLHLLGGLLLLVLLAVQVRLSRPAVELEPLERGRLRRAVLAVFVLAVVQIMLGGWVSTNYAVLACTDFPTCHGSWWPEHMDFSRAFRVLRPLGQDGGGEWLGAADLTAIHMAHRVGAAVALAALLWLGWRLWRVRGQDARLRRGAQLVWGIAAWQFASGLSNVVLGWPLVAALAHSAGAAALVLSLTFIRVGLRAPVDS